jgi:hypothetical protein
MAQNEKTTSKATLALAWLAVGIPLIWGVVQTLQKAVKLFVHA